MCAHTHAQTHTHALWQVMLVLHLHSLGPPYMSLASSVYSHEQVYDFYFIYLSLSDCELSLAPGACRKHLA